MKTTKIGLMMAMAAAALFTSCSEEQGTEVGTDSAPAITVYQYTAPGNPDNDLFLRIASNNKVEGAYYLCEKTTDYDAHLAEMGEAGYADYVVSNGTKMEGVSGASSGDINITGLIGEYTITAVGEGGGAKAVQTAVFEGLEWQEYCTATFTSMFFGESWDQVVLKAKGKNRYRLPDCYTEGFNIDFTMDADGNVSFDKQSTGWNHPDYGLTWFGGSANGSGRDGQTVYLVGKMSVSAGSFGESEETLTLPEGK